MCLLPPHCYCRCCHGCSCSLQPPPAPSKACLKHPTPAAANSGRKGSPLWAVALNTVLRQPMSASTRWSLPAQAGCTNTKYQHVVLLSEAAQFAVKKLQLQQRSICHLPRPTRLPTLVVPQVHGVVLAGVPAVAIVASLAHEAAEHAVLCV